MSEALNPNTSPANPNVSQNLVPNNSTSQEKLHYDSLISLFKYCVGVFTVIGVVIGWLAYNNGQEMRQAMKEERKEMEERIKEMKGDLRLQEMDLLKKEEEMKKEVLKLVETTGSEVKNTRELAVAQIGSIQGVATTQARNRIDEIFRNNNFESFVENVARERIEPRINEIVDSKFDSLDDVKMRKVDELISELANSNLAIQRRSLSALQLNFNTRFTETQIKNIISALDEKKISSSLERTVCAMLLGQNSPFINDFFKRRLLAGYADEASIESGLTYTMLNKEPMSFYLSVLKAFNETFIYNNFIVYSQLVDKKMTVEFLNNKPLVDLVLRIAEREKNYQTVEVFKKNIEDLTKQGAIKGYEKLYFFSLKEF
ncbi:MAG: hypothetical protein J7623_27420 [Chitinophaga sp.]|uniref:hypothetical protein n=1 Tax=Chitinophaga sp. TaxID=1869181 RepID=UPI001B00F3E4|nr:hypothetical protein [Chitinophaga sp.]MBO9732402.1 hypothetical protein [Chitinophaga sp.]